MKNSSKFASTNKEISILITIYNITKKLDKMESKKQIQLQATDFQPRAKQLSPTWSFIFSIIGLALVLLLSYVNGKLFFRELMVSSMIITTVLSLKLISEKDLS